MEDKTLKASFLTRDTRETDANTSVMIPKQQMEILDNNDGYEDTSITFKGTLKYAPSFYINSIPLMFNRMNPYLLNMLSLMFIAFYGSATMTAGFGLGNAIFMFFWQTFTQVNGETQGINLSKAFGAGDYKTMRLYFYRGCVWNVIVTAISCVLYWNIDVILIAGGFEEEMTTQARAMVISMLPALWIQTCNEMIRNYLMSQKVSKPFVWINLVTFMFFPIGGYYIIYKSGWGSAGFGLFKGIVELINFTGLVILMKKFGHKESLRREGFKDILRGSDVVQYLRDFAKILMGWYAGYLGIEINTILCGELKDPIIMACWVTYMNIFAIVWTVGAGLAITTRTTCGMKIGENKPMVARKYAFMGLILGFLYSVVGGILICVFSKQIAGAFSEVPEVLEKLPWQICLMGMLTFFCGTGALASTIFRVVDRAGFYSMMSLSLNAVLSTTISCVFIFVLGLGAAGIGYSFLISWFLTFSLTLGFMIKFKWSSLERKETLTA